MIVTHITIIISVRNDCNMLFFPPYHAAVIK